MKQFVYYASLLVCAVLTSCGSNSGDSEVEAIPFQSESGGNWGLIKPDGSVIFADEFKNEPTVVTEGRFLVKNGDGLWEVYTAEAKPTKVGEEYTSLTNFNNGIALAVKKGERISIINTDGKVTATLDKAGEEVINVAYAFSEGYAVIQTDNGFGLIDASGKVVIEPNYLAVGSVSDGKVFAIEKKYEGEEEYPINILTPNGKPLYTIPAGKYKEVDNFYKFGKLAVQTEDGWGFIDEKGEVVVKPSSKIKKIGDVKAKYFTFYDGDAWGLKDFKDEVLIRPKYNHLFFASDDVLVAYHNGKFVLINTEGKEIADDDYKDITPSIDGKHLFVKISSKEYSIIDLKGKEIKGLPNIYRLGDETGDNVVMSDFLDIDAIVNKAAITTEGIGEYTFDKTAEQLATIWAQQTNSSKEIKPENFRTNNLPYSKLIGKANLTHNFVYLHNMAEDKSKSWYDHDYQWNTENPFCITLGINGYNIEDRYEEIYNQLVAKIKTLGTVAKEDKETTIITVSPTRGFVVENTKKGVTVKLLDGEAFQRLNVTSTPEEETSPELEDGGYEGEEEF